MPFEFSTSQQSTAFERLRAASLRADKVNLDGSYISMHIRPSGIYVCGASRSGLAASRIVSWSNLCLAIIDPLIDAEQVVLEQIKPAYAEELTNASC